MRDIGRAKTAAQRFFSIKAFHGVMMFWSWYSLVGRVFASNQTGDFTCYTYPAYKQVNASQGRTDGLHLEGKPLTMLPIEDPDYVNMPWAKLGGEVWWGVILFSTPVLAAVLFGLLFAKVSAWRENPMVERLAGPELLGSPGACRAGSRGVTVNILRSHERGARGVAPHSLRMNVTDMACPWEDVWACVAKYHQLGAHLVR